MNHRIERFFNEAGFHKPEMERLGIEHKFNKFAELIINKCIEIDIDNPDARPGVEIARYFGIK